MSDIKHYLCRGCRHEFDWFPTLFDMSFTLKCDWCGSTNIKCLDDNKTENDKNM